MCGLDIPSSDLSLQRFSYDVRANGTSMGYRRIAALLLLETVLAGKVTNAHTTYESPYGRIECEWDNATDKYTMRIRIPSNSKAIVKLPTETVEDVTDCGLPVSESKDMRNLEVADGTPKLAVGSGDCFF